MEDALKLLTIRIAEGTEAAAALIIGAAAIQATIRAAYCFVTATAGHQNVEEVRLQLGRWLALGLEFELAADILRTAVAPTWTEIGQLGAIIALRTLLNFFLQMEIDKANDRKLPAPVPDRRAA